MRLGILDIGSNTVHLVVVDAHPGAQPTPMASWKVSLRLLRFLDDTGALTDEGLAALLQAVQDAVEQAEHYEVERLIPMATSAIRDATNSAEVLRTVRTHTGVSLRILTGPEEARLTFLAVRRWHGWAAGELLMFDIGGGSLEIAQGSNEYPDAAVSVPLGAARQTREFLHHDPPTEAELLALRTSARKVLKRAAQDFAGLPVPDLAVGSSKTIRSLANLLGTKHPGGAGEVTVLPRSALARWLPLLTQTPVSALENLPGMTKDRAPQVAAGAMVLHEALRVWKVREVVSSPWALREGLVLRALDSLPGDADDLTQPQSGVASTRLSR
ncbi:MAG: Ppx/GppA family phosphatase [Microbacteriaceae bacterium]|jgi:exopolyphosphatase/guanosine-5'-triphosphate,3'-diphosphate pyrophosphatase|nr:Ppx/GppA family phosphatase [Microbacteriaceae bacterium]